MRIARWIKSKPLALFLFGPVESPRAAFLLPRGDELSCSGPHCRRKGPTSSVVCSRLLAPGCIESAMLSSHSDQRVRWLRQGQDGRRVRGCHLDHSWWPWVRNGQVAPRWHEEYKYLSCSTSNLGFSLAFSCKTFLVSIGFLSIVLLLAFLELFQKVISILSIVVAL